MAIHLQWDHVLTDRELLSLSARNPGVRFERTAEGRLVVSPTGSESGRMSAEVVGQLRDWNRRTALGVVFDSSTGFVFPDGSCRSPDASWLDRQRWNALSAEVREGFAPVCPEAVFEVRSRSDSLTELQAKMRAYLANGARIAVLVDAGAESVEVHRADGGVRTHNGREGVPLDPELPGFTFDPAPVFAG